MCDKLNLMIAAKFESSKISCGNEHLVVRCCLQSMEYFWKVNAEFETIQRNNQMLQLLGTGYIFHLER